MIIGSVGGIRTGFPKPLSINRFGQLLLDWPVDLQTHFSSPCILVPSPTLLSAPFVASGSDVYTPAAAANHLLAIVDQLTAVFLTGAASQYLGDPMARMRRKTDLPTKLCIVCRRTFIWQKNVRATG